MRLVKRNEIEGLFGLIELKNFFRCIKIFPDKPSFLRCTLLGWAPCWLSTRCCWYSTAVL
jgi:hypothetical protein